MSEWVKCSDRLPEKSGLYPCCSTIPQRSYSMESWLDMLCMFDKDAKPGEAKWQHSSGFYDNGITHWMDMPGPPNK